MLSPDEEFEERANEYSMIVDLGQRCGCWDVLLMHDEETGVCLVPGCDCTGFHLPEGEENE